MKQPKAEYYVQVQRHKTIKYGEKQHHQDYITIPMELSVSLRLQPGQVMKCAPDGNGNSLTYTKVSEKPIPRRMNYEQWRDIVKELIPLATEKGKTYEQIRQEGNIPAKTAPAIWVRQAETDIGLRRIVDPRSKRILWTKVVPVLVARRFMDTTLFEISDKPS